MNILLRSLLLLLLLALLGAGAFALHHFLGWPWPWLAGGAAGILLLVLLSLLARRLWLRRRQEKYLGRIIDRDGSTLVEDSSGRRIAELRRAWHNGILRLRTSHLSGPGDPVYGLPWFLVLGASGSGKSSLFSSLRLQAHAGTNAAGRPGRTAGLDWWFFEQGVYLDTAGRFASPSAPDADEKEWAELLGLLAAYRRRESLNGIIVTLPCDELLGADHTALQAFGRGLRSRLDSLAFLGSVTPVYVLLTKLDLLPGFAAFADLLSDEEQGQAIGALNTRGAGTFLPDSDPKGFAARALALLVERLFGRSLLLGIRSRLCRGIGSPRLASELLALAPAIQTVIDAVFFPRTGSETPLLRGIFLAGSRSALAPGKPLAATFSEKPAQEQESASLPEQPQPVREAARKAGPATAPAAAAATVPVAAKGQSVPVPVQTPIIQTALFGEKADKTPEAPREEAAPAAGESCRTVCLLKDLFLQILPGERAISSLPGRRPLRLVLSRSGRLLVWLGFLFLVAAYMSVSYLSNKSLIEQTRESLTACRPGSGADFVPSLARLAEVLGSTQAKLAHHVFLYPGYAAARRMHAEGKKRFVSLVRDNLMVDKESAERMGRSLSPKNQQLLMVLLCEYFAWGNEVITAAEKGSTPPEILVDTDLTTAPALAALLPKGTTDMQTIFTAYARWENPAELERLRAWHRQRIDAFLGLLSDDMDWLVPWLDTRSSLSDVRMADFWPGTVVRAGVDRAFTPPALARLDRFLDSVARSTGEPEAFRQRVRLLHDRYADTLRAAWWNMARTFPQGFGESTRADLWNRLTDTVHEPANPYFTFIRRISEAFSTVANLGSPTPLDALPVRFAQMLAEQARPAEPATLKEQAEEKAKALVQPLDSAKSRDEEELKSLTKFLDIYLKALKSVHDATVTDESSFDLVQGCYASLHGTKNDNALLLALSQMQDLEMAMDREYTTHAVFWQLVEGPVAALTTVAVLRSACNLNSLWTDSVLETLGTLPPDEYSKAMLDEKNAYATFVEQKIRPFLRGRPGSYGANSWLGISYPLTQEFLDRLNTLTTNKAVPKDGFSVKIEALPLNVNATAQKPYRVQLDLKCEGKKPQRLENYNYPASLDFLWDPESCSSTALTISFEGLDIRKVWSGNGGFQDFLRDFANGSVTFTPDDFPDRAESLRRLDVSAITVRYRISGGFEVEDWSPFAPPGLPNSVAWCRRGLSNTQANTVLQGIRITPDTARTPSAPKAGSETPTRGTRP